MAENRQDHPDGDRSGALGAGSIDPRFDDDRLTAMGLFVETYTAIMETVESELAGGGLTGSAFEVMIRLCRSPDQRLRMTELAAQSTLTNSGLTRVVDRLERDGLVVREPCAHDRRGFWAVATPLGLEHMASLLPDHLSTIGWAFTDVLDPDELDRFLTALRRIRAVVRPSADPDLAAGVADG